VEVLNRAAVEKHRLADVDNFGGALAHGQNSR
jgi:hypothetical protein